MKASWLDIHGIVKWLVAVPDVTWFIVIHKGGLEKDTSTQTYTIYIIYQGFISLFTAAEVQCFQLRYALDKFTRKSNQALARIQCQHFQSRKLQEHIS